jgi:hypothetical protein
VADGDVGGGDIVGGVDEVRGEGGEGADSGGAGGFGGGAGEGPEIGARGGGGRRCFSFETVAVAEREFLDAGGGEDGRPVFAEDAAEGGVAVVAAVVILVQEVDEEGVFAAEFFVVGARVAGDEGVEQDGVVEGDLVGAVIYVGVDVGAENFVDIVAFVRGLGLPDGGEFFGRRVNGDGSGGGVPGLWGGGVNLG